MKKRILIVCTGNSCRSQMAEGLVNALWGESWEGFSAGTKPSTLNRLAIDAMAEIGIDISGQRSKHVDEFLGQSIDLVVTVCDDAAENCPFIPGAKKIIHMPIPDPAQFTDLPDEQAMLHFREACERLKKGLEELFASYSQSADF